MNLNKGDKVLCVENNSTIRPLMLPLSRITFAFSGEDSHFKSIL